MNLNTREGHVLPAGTFGTMLMMRASACALLVTATSAAPEPDIGADISLKDYHSSTTPPPAAPFRFSSAYSDDMVLQQAPAQAIVWGFAPSGSKVTISFGGKSIDAPVAPYMGESTFMAKLPATPSSLTEMHNISATSSGKTITLANVLFGDVWVCSGQSNMQYPIGSPTCWNESNINCTVRDQQCGYGCVNNSAAEIAAMADYPHMRLSQNTDRGSKVPLAESGNTGWMTPAKMGGKFSATCWFTFRDVYKALESPRPIGLIETNVGGTPDQHWSSPEALNKCKNLPGSPKWEWPSNFTDSVLWNGKIVPLLRTTIKGAIWYQGEANSRADGRQYNCSFPAMIEDWREKWFAHTDGATDKAFPFGWAQLNSNGEAEMYTGGSTASVDPTDPLGQWTNGFPSIRNAESHTLSLANTFQAVIIDTPVASGSVHSPWKQQVGARMARGALNIGYGVTEAAKVNPVPVSAKQSGSNVTVSLSGLGASGVILKENRLGFEVMDSTGKWTSTPITSKAADSVTFGPAPVSAKAVRYLWYSSPCSPYAGPQVPYHCPVYTDVAPLGGLSGEQVGLLPLGPFILEL